MASVKPANTNSRRAMLAKVHIAKKDLGLGDDAYRDVLEGVTGKRSSGHMSAPELDAVLARFRALGWTPRRTSSCRTGSSSRQTRDRLAQGPHTAKVRALWLSAWHLGVTRSRSDEALTAFVKRQTGLDAAAWAGAPAESWKVIEGLKCWLARDAGVNWEPYETPGGDIDNPRARVLEAQWRKAHELGLVAVADTAAIGGYAQERLKLDHKVSHTALTDMQADILIRHFGERIRAANEPEGTAGRKEKQPEGTAGRKEKQPEGTAGRKEKQPEGTAGRKGEERS